MINKLKIYGLKRTGTNFFKRLIEANYEVCIDENSLGWKHGPYIQHLISSNKKLHSVILIKHPLAWLDSIHRHLKSNWNFAHLCKHYAWEWTTMYMYWDDFTRKNTDSIIVRYEDLLKNSDATLCRVSKKFNIHKRNRIYTEIDYIVTPSKKLLNGIFDKSYYLQKKYMKSFSDNLIKSIYEILDDGLLKKYEYTI